MFDDSRPIFAQLADQLADEILRGRYAEGEQVPSMKELAAHMRINPATAGKALNLLAERGIVHKRRGLGMFVTDGARTRITQERHQGFIAHFVTPLLVEARTIGLSREQVLSLITAETEQPSTATQSSEGTPSSGVAPLNAGDPAPWKES